MFLTIYSLQIELLQFCSSKSFPSQTRPPGEGGGLLHCLVLSLDPEPQVLEQGLHGPQLLHAGTPNIQKKFKTI